VAFKFLTTVSLLWFFFSSTVEAAMAKEAPDYFSLSLEELVQIPVRSATRTNLPIQRTPGVVRSFSRQDIENLGIRSVKDLLGFVPGIQISQYRAGHGVIWVRGVQSRYNDKVLLLLNGMPMRDSYYGHFSLESLVPVDLIEKIEILNGPGSVLYGANAFGGVISITTRKKGSALNTGLGSFNTQRLSLQTGDREFYGYLAHESSSGFKPERSFEGDILERDQNQRVNTGYFHHSADEFEIFAGFSKTYYPQKYHDFQKHYFYERGPKFGAVRLNKNLENLGELEILFYHEKFNLTRLRYKLEKTDLTQLASNNQEYLDSVLSGFDAVLKKRTGSHQLLFGLAYQQDKSDHIARQELFKAKKGKPKTPRGGGIRTEDNLFGGQISRENTSIFLQDLYEVNSHTLLSLGARFDALSDFENQWNYRLGLTRQKGDFYSKLLLGTAYRVPSYREYLDKKSFNTMLKPEELRTIEAQIGLTKKRFDLNLTYFQNDYEDFIKELDILGLDLNGDGKIDEKDGDREIEDEYFVNARQRETSGLELALQVQPRENFRLRAGYTYFIKASENLGFSLDELGIILDTDDPRIASETKDLPFLAQNSWFLSGTRHHERSSYGFNARHYSARTLPSDYHQDVPIEVQSKNNLEAFLKLDLHFNFQLNKTLSWKIQLDNVFDKRIYSGPYANSNAYDIEWPGRTVWTSLSYAF
jgi:outer membrane receptor for ferrienterochelin and colicins